jgi:hypothetical protein
VSVPRFAIVGHPNKGKSSIAATFAEDEGIAISPEPGTTTQAIAYPMRVDGEPLYELIDTPGFQRAREVLDWLDRHERGAGDRAEVVQEFLQNHRGDPHFRDECELLQPIVDGAGILYVVDGSRPYGRQYEPEMEILRRSGRPRMALINMIGPGDHIESWHAALSQYFSIVRVFDAVRADFSKRIDLLRAFGALEERWAAQLNRAADILVAERQRRKQRAADAIANLMIAVLTASVQMRLSTLEAQRRVEQQAREKLRDTVRQHERDARRAVQEIYRHADADTQLDEEALLAEDVFSKRSFSVFGLSTAQLAMAGAASGAAAGGVVDIAVGGTSLLLGAGVGALLGAAGIVAGANRLAKVEVLGRPLGGYELRVGPITDPNLPWVLLARALLHVRVISERNHARRESLVLAASDGGHPLDAAERRRLGAVFRRLQSEQGADAAMRLELSAAIAAAIETP